MYKDRNENLKLYYTDQFDLLGLYDIIEHSDICSIQHLDIVCTLQAISPNSS